MELQGAERPDAIEGIAEQLRTMMGTNCKAVLLTGSFAYGRPRSTSDIDFQVVVRSSPPGRKLFTHGDRRVDAWVMSIDDVMRNVHRNDGALLQMYGYARPVGATDEDVSAALAIARERFERGLPTMMGEEARLVGIRIANLISDLAERDFSSSDGRLVFQAVTWDALQIALRVARIYHTKHIDDLVRLEEKRPRDATALRSILIDEDRPAASIRLIELLETLGAAVGGVVWTLS